MFSHVEESSEKWKSGFLYKSNAGVLKKMAGVGFRWLDILEKEFDNAFVDLDLTLGKCNVLSLKKGIFIEPFSFNAN